MILDRYIFKELFKSQFVILFIFISIFAAQSLIRLVTDAASGDIPAVLITKVLLFSLPEFLTLLLPLTLYVAIIITLGRICTDSEMVAMKAVGFSPKRIMMVCLMLACLSATVAAYIGLVLAPKAAIALKDLEVQASQNPEFLPIDSGRFVSFGKYNIYVEEVIGSNASDKQVDNVYVIDSESPEELSITVASKGHIVIDDEGVRWLVLNDGRRYENPADGSFRLGNFSQFRAPLSGNVTDANAKGSDLSTKSSSELLFSDDIKAQEEFQWRIAPVFTVIVMCIVAVPLSMVNPRQGRFTRLMPAIVIYVAYYLFLLSLHNMIITGTVPLYPGLYLVPICFMLFVAVPLNMPKTYIKQKISDKKALRQNQLLKSKSSIGSSDVAILDAANSDDLAGDSALSDDNDSALAQDKTVAVQAKDAKHPANASGQATNVSEIIKNIIGDDESEIDPVVFTDKETEEHHVKQKVKHGLPKDLGGIEVKKDQSSELKIAPVSGTNASELSSAPEKSNNGE